VQDSSPEAALNAERFLLGTQVIGGDDDYKPAADPLRKKSVAETIEHFRTSGCGSSAKG